MTSKRLMSTDTDNYLAEVANELMELYYMNDITEDTQIDLAASLQLLADRLIRDIEIFKDCND